MSGERRGKRSPVSVSPENEADDRNKFCPIKASKAVIFQIYQTSNRSWLTSPKVAFFGVSAGTGREAQEKTSGAGRIERRGLRLEAGINVEETNQVCTVAD